MISLDNSGIPRDDQVPDLAPATLRLLSDQIADATGGAPARTAVRRPGAAVRGIRRPWLRRSALIAAAAAAAVAVTSAVLPSPPAEAWSATPTLADAGTWATLEAECRQQNGWQSQPSTARAVIAEQRGDSTFTVLADATMCLQAISFDGSLKPVSGGQELLPAALPGAGEVQVIHANVLYGEADVTSDEHGNRVETLTRGYVDTIGRVGPGVEDIVIHTVDNGDVTASIDNGWFAAWWPSLATLPTSMTVTTTTGTYDLDLCGETGHASAGARC
jgi:hypothetical protein